MRFILAAATAALMLTAQTVTADAKGCIKGALVGGAAGHMVGHGKMGAVAGCVVGHQRELEAAATATERLEPVI
jgi:outer membrane lipoprotein SlyB